MGSEKIKLNIDGQDIETETGKSVLEASLDAGYYIPHLCHHPDLSSVGACRLCVVEIEGMAGLPASCTTPAGDGMIVRTKTERAENMRRLAMELMLAGHPADCGTCQKYLNCELQSLKQYLIGDDLTVRRRTRLLPVNTGNPLFVHDPNKCVVCGRCVRACHELRGVGVLYYQKKGKETCTGTAADLPLADAGCRFCGACAEVCPTGAIQDREEFTRGKNRKTTLIPCRYSCPAEIDVPGYIRFIQKKDYAAAAALVREKVPFPGVLGYVCDHPCEGACRRGEVNQPVSIRELKRFAAEHDEARLWEKSSEKGPSSGKKVAIVGAGPAGLTAAYYLSNRGHAVTVFEALPLPGGMLRFGIPEYRLPRDVLDSEIRFIENRGVEIKTDTRVESIDRLLEQGHDAVLVAVGTQQGQKLPIPGADNEKVFVGVDFLRDVNMGKRVSIGKKVVVLGGGNIAFDCARVARRLGAEMVNIACLEGREEMPADRDEIKQGEEEGISVHPAKTFTRILSENGRITGVACVDVASFHFDEENRLQIEVQESAGQIIEADTVIFAVGQWPEIPEDYGLDTAENNLILLEPYTWKTRREGVFAAGDAVSGTTSVIKAIASGRKSAVALDRFLGGSGDIDEHLAPPSELKVCLGPAAGFASMERREVSCVLPEKRLEGFGRVVGDMDADGAYYESKRCLQCDLRLKITPVKFWGSY